MLLIIAQTSWELFLELLKYPPGSMIFILLLSVFTTMLSTILTKLLTNTGELKKKQNIIKEHKKKRDQIEKELKEQNPKKYNKELIKWNRQDKAMKKMEQKLSMQRMKPTCFMFIPMMLMFPLIGGFFGTGPVAIPAMNPFDVPLLGGFISGYTDSIPVNWGMINYISWYMLCSFTSNMIIGRLAGTYMGGGFGQMFEKARLDAYKDAEK
ncbi:MAG: EMC3/TMCO1 family protein [Promethearchaeota archaeon]